MPAGSFSNSRGLWIECSVDGIQLITLAIMGFLISLLRPDVLTHTKREQCPDDQMSFSPSPVNSASIKLDSSSFLGILCTSCGMPVSISAVPKPTAGVALSNNSGNGEDYSLRGLPVSHWLRLVALANVMSFFPNCQHTFHTDRKSVV